MQVYIKWTSHVWSKKCIHYTRSVTHGEKTPNMLPSVFPFLSGVPLRLPHCMASLLPDSVPHFYSHRNIWYHQYPAVQVHQHCTQEAPPCCTPIASMPPPCYSTLPPSACLSNTFCLISVHSPCPCQSLPNISQPVAPSPKHIQLLSAPSLGPGYLPFN